MKRVVIATRNRGKLVELSDLLKSLGWELVTIDEVAPGAVLREDGNTFEQNAVAKAKQAAAATGMPAIADDSGLEVEALGGQPGVHSARWAGEPCDDARNNARLIELIHKVPTGRRTAFFRCVAAYVDLQAHVQVVREGSCEGRILDGPRGTAGFGYDPLFLVPPLGKTMAELTLEQKNGISHRSAAFRALAEALKRVP